MYRFECVSAAPSKIKDVPVVPTCSQKSGKFTSKLNVFRDNSHVDLNEKKMPAREDMDLSTDKLLSKGRILQELTKAVKLVYAQSLHGTVVLDGDCWLVYWLDRALRHGLRVERHGYWGTVRELSHQDTIVVIHALQSVLTSIGKGRAWLYHTLSEGSFESYLACFLRDSVTLRKQYFPHALVRDCDKTHQLINLLAGLENVSFTLQLDVTYLDICNYMPQRPMSGSPSGIALSLHLRSSSNTSSLASPGDSGVALDSDMDISNETDASSYKEEDSSTYDMPKYSSMKYKSIMNNCSQDNKNLERSFSSSDSSEDGKTPIHSPALHSKFQYVNITKSDIANKNVISHIIDDNELNCSSLDTLKDYSIYSNKVDKQQFDKVNNEYDNLAKDFSKRNSYLEDGGYSFKKNNDSRPNSYVINNDTNLLELSMTISDCDCCAETPYSILNTVNMTDSCTLSISGTEAVVQRRQRKKKRGENKKRVSFHEDIFKTMKLDDDENYSDFSMSFVSSNSIQKKDTQKGRYSWCANGDSPYVEKMVNTRNAHSDYYSSLSSDGNFDSDGDYSKMIGKTSDRPSMSERGVPEGQEDPTKILKPKMEIELAENEAQEAYVVEKKCGYINEDVSVKVQMPPPINPNKYSSSSDWSDIESMTNSVDLDDRKNLSRHLSSPLKKRNITSIFTGNPCDYNGRLVLPVSTTAASRQIPSNTSLLGRFLRSITERKFDLGNFKKNKKVMTSSTLYIKGVKDVNYDSFKDFNDNLEKEMQENMLVEKCDLYDEKISSKLRETFKRHIYRDKNEELYKIYKVRSSYMNNSESRAMLALLTDKTLYLTGSKSDNTYSNQFVIPYNELDVIMIGPNAQTILISNADYEMQYLFSTGSLQITSELIAHLETAMRRSPAKPKLPAVKELNYSDMHCLKHSILSDTSMHVDEKIEHYNIVYVEDDHISPPTTPLGPMKEGDLMFRPHSYQLQSSHPNAPTHPWEAGYFVLKGGVVYMFTDSSQQLPKRAIPLKGGLCHGCRRIPNSHRPHTFEILLKPNKSFQFAAPDEYVASEWLQSIVQSASGLFDISEKKNPLPCSLVVTTRHLITMKEVFPGSRRGQTLSCASVEDLTAFRMPLAQQSWCILEFACREVLESSGDWVIYFTNYTELCAFREALESLWADAQLGEFPMITVPPDNDIYRRCFDTNKDLEHAWQHLLLVSPE